MSVRRFAEAAYDRVNHLATAELAARGRGGGRAALRVHVLDRARRPEPRPTEPLTEAAAPAPTDAYGRSKLAAEAAVRASGVPYTILRPVLVYGPRREGQSRKPDAARRAARSRCRSARLSNRRSLLALDNLIAAVRFALEDPRAANETFLVADPEAISVAELVAMLRAAAGRKPWLIPVPPGTARRVLGLTGQRDDWSSASPAR